MPLTQQQSWLHFPTTAYIVRRLACKVYEDQLVGLMGFVGLEEDQFLLGLSGVGGDGAGGGGGGSGGGKRKRCRSSSFSGSGVSAGLSPSAKKVKTGKDKRLRCRLSSFGSAAEAMGASPASASTKVNKRDKRMPVSPLRFKQLIGTNEAFWGLICLQDFVARAVHVKMLCACHIFYHCPWVRENNVFILLEN